MERKHAIIVAGGEGTRMGGTLPKQFQTLGGRPVAWWSLKAFHDEDPDTEIVLVVNAKCLDLWDGLFRSLPESDRIAHRVVAGGSTRTESVKNGLAVVEGGDGSLVAVHDAARPLVTAGMISRGWDAARRHGGAVPAVAVVDSLRRREGEGRSHAVDRSQFVAVQTPQVFRTDLLVTAYASNPEGVFTDDASAIELAGEMPALFDGSQSNFKVTSPGDIERAEIELRKRD